MLYKVINKDIHVYNPETTCISQQNSLEHCGLHIKSWGNMGHSDPICQPPFVVLPKVC